MKDFSAQKDFESFTNLITELKKWTEEENVEFEHSSLLKLKEKVRLEREKQSEQQKKQEEQIINLTSRLKKAQSDENTERFLEQIGIMNKRIERLEKEQWKVEQWGNMKARFPHWNFQPENEQGLKNFVELFLHQRDTERRTRINDLNLLSRTFQNLPSRYRSQTLSPQTFITKIMELERKLKASKERTEGMYD